MLALLLCAALVVVPVPGGDVVMVNGLVGEGEWSNSGELKLDDATTLRFHATPRYLFLAVVFHGPKHTGIDLHLHSLGATRMLHVSSALGEKTLVDGTWSDYAWGENAWWTANGIGSIWDGSTSVSLKPQGFEFQIDRRELGPDVALYIRLKRPAKTLPAGASEDAVKNWIRLTLEESKPKGGGEH